LLAWLDAGALKPCSIAVPGCGSGWDVVELARRGFDVQGIDLVPAACARAMAALQAAGVVGSVVRADVLAYRPAHAFDAVYEQTCLCAIHPTLWSQYEASLHAWLKPGGRLYAMFMQCRGPGEQARQEGPPYHCDLAAMRVLFDDSRWLWPDASAVQVPHPRGWHELGLILERR
jgi:cyclopropane fatty-acyl-phospholipid synthase-like methyltransferase